MKKNWTVFFWILKKWPIIGNKITKTFITYNNKKKDGGKGKRRSWQFHLTIRFGITTVGSTLRSIMPDRIMKKNSSSLPNLPHNHNPFATVQLYPDRARGIFDHHGGMVVCGILYPLPLVTSRGHGCEEGPAMMMSRENLRESFDTKII